MTKQQHPREVYFVWDNNWGSDHDNYMYMYSESSL